jgi:large subunit ribosomal protein L10
MAISRSKKEEVVLEVEKRLEKSLSAVFVNYKGIDVPSLEKMRNDFRKEDVDFKVIKKTLLQLILKKKNIIADIDALEGQIAVIFANKDEISAAKSAHTFSKENDKLEILAGIFSNEYVDRSQVVALAQVPSRDELLAKMVGSMNAPVSGFVNVLQGNIRGLVQVLNQISQK